MRTALVSFLSIRLQHCYLVTVLPETQTFLRSILEIARFREGFWRYWRGFDERRQNPDPEVDSSHNPSIIAEICHRSAGRRRFRQQSNCRNRFGQWRLFDVWGAGGRARQLLFLKCGQCQPWQELPVEYHALWCLQGHHHDDHGVGDSL